MKQKRQRCQPDDTTRMMIFKWKAVKKKFRSARPSAAYLALSFPHPASHRPPSACQLPSFLSNFARFPGRMLARRAANLGKCPRRCQGAPRPLDHAIDANYIWKPCGGPLVNGRVAPATFVACHLEWGLWLTNHRFCVFFFSVLCHKSSSPTLCLKCPRRVRGFASSFLGPSVRVALLVLLDEDRICNTHYSSSLLRLQDQAVLECGFPVLCHHVGRHMSDRA